MVITECASVNPKPKSLVFQSQLNVTLPGQTVACGVAACAGAATSAAPRAPSTLAMPISVLAWRRLKRPFLSCIVDHLLVAAQQGAPPGSSVWIERTTHSATTRGYFDLAISHRSLLLRADFRCN
jgi:hypothetical protein